LVEEVALDEERPLGIEESSVGIDPVVSLFGSCVQRSRSSPVSMPLAFCLYSFVLGKVDAGLSALVAHGRRACCVDSPA